MKTAILILVAIAAGASLPFAIALSAGLGLLSFGILLASFFGAILLNTDDDNRANGFFGFCMTVGIAAIIRGISEALCEAIFGAYEGA